MWIHSHWKFLIMLPLAGIFYWSSTLIPQSFLSTGQSEPVFFATADADQLSDPDKEQLLLRSVLAGLKNFHFDERPLDEEFSKRAYTLYLRSLDSRKRFLLLEDVNKLEQYQNRLHYQVEEASTEFFDLSVSLMDKRIAEARLLFDEIIDKPVDLYSDAFMESSPERIMFPETRAEQKSLWQKAIAYDVLSRIHRALERHERALETNPDAEIKPLDELEAEARERVRENYNEWFKRLETYDRRDRYSDYLNAIAGAYDPHTNYFEPVQRQNFDIGMSGRLEGIGARLTSRDGYTIVSEIVPGSPSWIQGELKADDIILAVAEDGEDPVELKDMRLDDVVSLVRGPKGTKVILTVRKVDETVIDIPIIRDVVILEEGFARSALLDFNNQKFGIIHLPKFYADFNNTGGRNCTDDVRDEITKLKNDGIEGLILDLRNNSGGSLNDVVRMTGLFIERGPIVQVQSREGRPRVLRDTDASVHYDGPLVILVNAFSASASEIMAAALQDYGRAIIIGSASTYGKGTVQRFIDLDRLINGFEEHKPLGSLKMTIQKFYRINGGTTQLYGVVPDIVLPDRYQYVDIGEKAYDFPLDWSEIDALRFEQKVLDMHQQLPLLIVESQSRIQNDTYFNYIEQEAVRMKQMQENTLFPLHLDKFRERMTDARTSTRPDELENYNIEGLAILTPKADQIAMAGDSSRINRIQAWHENLQKDRHLEESLRIFIDYIQ